MDPPPPTNEPAAAVQVVPPANPTAPVQNHPPYPEMITAAIAALKDKNGSSKRAISNYIEKQFSNLPPTHSALLTENLRRLKNSGNLLMVKHSYMFPRSTPVPIASNGNVDVVSAPASTGPKKRPGRPPKPKPFQATLPIPVFVPEAQLPVPANLSIPNSVPAVVPGTQQNMAVGPGTVYGSVGPVNGPASAVGVVGKRVRGRPPKQGGPNQGGRKRTPGRPPKSVGAQPGGVLKPRGRPKKDTSSSSSAAAFLTGTASVRRPKKNVTAAARVKGPGRPRGRPTKLKNAGFGVAPSAAVDGTVEPAAVGAATGGTLAIDAGGAALAQRRGRGRPPKAVGETNKPMKQKKPRNSSGKPVGRPRKSVAGATIIAPAPDTRMLAYEDLKGKLEYMKSRTKLAVSMIKPFLNSETAIAALQELEMLASMDVNAPTGVQGLPPPPPPQPLQPPTQS